MDELSNDLQTPDESRPAKRVRLDAPLSLTEETVAEMNDEDDWDDVYHDETEKSAARQSRSETIATNLPTEVTALPNSTPHTQVNAEGLDAVPPDAVSEGDELVGPQPSVQGSDQPSTHMLAEVSETLAEPSTQVHLPEPTIQPQGVQSIGGDSVVTHTPDEKGETVAAEDKGYTVDHNKEDSLKNEAETEESRIANNGHVLASAQAEGVSSEDAMVIDETSQPSVKVTEDQEFMAAVAAQKGNQQAEWQFDPSDGESSDTDSSDSDDSSDDSDSDSEGGYEMLDAATAARILMSGDGDDDDGDRGKGKNGGDHQPRTANEKKEEYVPKPDIELTPDMKITLLGIIESAVDNLILVKGATPGEYQVLESGSVLCTENRNVIGAVADTFGRVQEPLYSVAFTSAQEIHDYGLELGTKLFYVDDHSTFVFTQPLRNLKGTDASNIHDEEVGEDEIEFSDDEAEAEYKRQKKLAKKTGRGGLSRSAFNDSFRSSTPRDSGTAYSGASDVPAQAYGGGMSYDDDGQVEGGAEEFYNPLKRPDNLSQLMAGGPSTTGIQPSTSDRSRGRGRGDRGRGRGDRGRGRGRGGHESHRRAQPGQTFGRHQDQHAHRGSAHSFPDRHNHGLRGSKQPHALPPRPPAAPTGPSTFNPSSQQAQRPPQAYASNGPQLPYANSGMDPQPFQTPSHIFNPDLAHQQTTYSQIPTGAYVNPVFYPYQAQQQAPQTFQHFPSPHQNQPPYAQPHSGAQQVPDLADIMRRLGEPSRQQ